MTAVQLAGDAESFTSFGALLRFLRLRARITQRDLSIAVGYNFAQISRLEQGQRLPDPAMIAAVFVPALDLAPDSPWAARLVALAEQARRPPPLPTATVPTAVALAQPPLLATKLFAPRVRPNAVLRPRLTAHLARAADAPLTLIAAPAGFGKTALLAEWLAALATRQTADRRPQTADRSSTASDNASSERSAVGGREHSELSAVGGRQFAWLSLDAGDNDPTTFLRYLIAALQTAAPDLGATALGLLKAGQPPPLDTLVRLLLNDLAALPFELLLVLDDYHIITTPAIHAALAVLLEYMPPSLHLVIASREDPPLPLARMRARGQLVELRADDVRFTADEAAAFLTDAMALPLEAEHIAVLETRTEGWIAGLQLAALAMRNRADLPAFIRAFTGSNRFVIDYLATEVFALQPPHIQSFLLQTAVLNQLCGELCDAVLAADSGRQTADRSSTNRRPPTADRSQTANDEEISGQRSAVSGRERSEYGGLRSAVVLEELERANLFLVPLDDERRWFRYHHLFGAFLRERLRISARPEEVAALHARASAWHEAREQTEEAVQYALDGGLWEQAARVIEERGLTLMMGGQVRTGLAWLKALPPAVLANRPLACIIHAIGLMLVNDPDEAEARLRDAEQSIDPDTPAELAATVRGSVAGVRGRFLYFAGDLARAIPIIEQALELLPATTTGPATERICATARAAWAVYLATDYHLTGDVSASSERRVAATIAPARAVGHLMATLNAYTSLADLQALQGRLRAAAATYAEVDRLVPGHDALQSLVGSPSYYFGIGDLLREWDRLDEAERYLARGMELMEGALATEGEVIAHGYLALARVQQAKGNGDEALATLRSFAQLARDRRLAPLLVERAGALQARFHLLEGDVAAATRWLEASGLSERDALSFPREALYLAVARVRIAAGDAAAVMPLLQRLRADAEANERGHSLIEVGIVQALAHRALHDDAQALAALEAALALAEPQGYVRSFADEGAPLAALLREAHKRGVAPAYIERLLAAVSRQGDKETRRQGDGSSSPSLLVSLSPASEASNSPPLLRAERVPVEPLTERERDVLGLVAAGHTNAAIAVALVIELGTVKRHLHSLLGKLGARNRTEAVARARELGLL